MNIIKMIISIYSCIYIHIYIDVYTISPDERIPLSDRTENFTSYGDRLILNKQFKT